MALRATRYLVNGMVGNRSFASSTTPKMKLFSPAVDAVHAHDHPKSSWGSTMKGEYAPVYVVMGMVLVAMTIGTHTAKQQLLHSPGVQVNKKKRESMPEVDQPDDVVGSADKFINKSFLRKVGHIQNHDPILSDVARLDPFTRSREVETLKSVGVAPHSRQ